ncbi:MAG: hypothetical protein SCJ97_06400 [Bacillota bacterium]|nr:hypothetical protein [Bacillota bacterium]
MRFTEIFPDYRELMKKDNEAIWQEIDYLVQFLRNGLQKISSKEGLQ